MREKKKTVGFFETWKELCFWDYLIFLILAGICFLSFQQNDLLHTAGCSYGYLNGHILDFYDYCGQFDIHPSYMPSMYLLFAIWNIPMRILGIVTVPTENLPLLAIMWAKLLPCILYMISGFVIYGICMEIGMGRKKSKLCTYASLTMPIGFYAQFIFGQYDIFMVLCILLGVYFYLKNKDFYFIFWFAIAITFKYSALLIFLPLLLLKTKNVWKIILSCVAAAVPYGIEFLLYIGSEAFSNYAFGIGSSGDNPTGYIFNATLFTGFQLGTVQFSVSLVIMGFGIICALAYFTRVKEKKELIKWMLYLCCLVSFVLFGLAKWHPQWLLMAVPFWVISAFIHRDTKIFMIIDILFMMFFTIFNVMMIPNNVDQAMFNHGIFQEMVNGDIGTKLTMGNLIGKLDPMICLSMISMIMLVYALFKHPKYCAESFAVQENCMGWIRTRFVVGVAMFVVPAFLCLYASQVGTQPTYEVKSGTSGVILSEQEDSVVQPFISQGSILDQIQFPVMTNGRANNVDLVVTLREQSTGKELYTESFNASGWWDGKLIQLFTGEIPTEKDEVYEVVFKIEPRETESKLALYLNTVTPIEHDKEKSVIEGEKNDSQVQMIVYQK